MYPSQNWQLEADFFANSQKKNRPAPDLASMWKFEGWFQWIGLRENLQETIDFPIKYGALLQSFP